MTITITSTSADETLVTDSTSNWTQPPPAPVLVQVVFNPGFGQDRLVVDGAASQGPFGGGARVTPNPYTIHLGAGIRPEDVHLFKLDDVYFNSPTSNTYYPNVETGWNVGWLLKVEHTGDQIFVDDFVHDTSPTKPANLLDRIQGPVQIEFADGTVWSTQQVLDMLRQSPLVDTVQGSSGSDLLTSTQGNDLIDLSTAAGGTDALVAWRGDGSDTVKGALDELRLQGGIRKGDLQFSDSGRLIVIEGQHVAYQLTAEQLGHITFDDGSSMSANEIAQARLQGSRLDDVIQGGDGDDRIFGREGNDTLIGGAGNDYLDGGQGYNLLQGGAGDDTLVATSDAGSTLDGGAGHDTYVVAQGHSVIIRDVVGDDQDLVLLDASSQGAQFSYDGANGTLSIAAGSTRVGIANFAGTAVDQPAAIGSVQFNDGKVYTASDIYKLLAPGTAGNDLISGFSWADQLAGGSGDDTIYGYGGSDTLVGGLGNDSLVGGTGNNVYRYTRGDGQDVIEVQGGGASNDTLELGAGITLKDLAVVAGANVDGLSYLDLIFKDGKGSIQLSCRDSSLSAAATLAALPKVKFADGTVIKGSDLYAKAVSNKGTNGADSLYADTTFATLEGGKGSDSLVGNLGTDFLSGGDGADTLRGGAGADYLDGGKGGDTYLYARGDGQDTIVDTDSSWFVTDTLKLAGITSRQLWFGRQGNDLDIQVIGSNGADDIHVQNWFGGSANQIERIVGSDGKTLSASKVQGLVNAMASLTPPATADISATTTSTSLNKLVASSWV